MAETQEYWKLDVDVNKLGCESRRNNNPCFVEIYFPNVPNVEYRPSQMLSLYSISSFWLQLMLEWDIIHSFAHETQLALAQLNWRHSKLHTGMFFMASKLVVDVKNESRASLLVVKIEIMWRLK